jgi:hypothetical protein
LRNLETTFFHSKTALRFLEDIFHRWNGISRFLEDFSGQ